MWHILHVFKTFHLSHATTFRNWFLFSRYRIKPIFTTIRLGILLQKYFTQLFLNSKAVFRSILQENPRGPASRGDRLFSFQTFFLSGEVIISLHNRRFMSQARRTRHFARSVGRARIARRGEEKNKALYATCTSLMMHLICPPKFCTSIVFNFPWDGCNTQEKWKTKVMQNFGGQIRCFMGDVQFSSPLVSRFAHVSRFA